MNLAQQTVSATSVLIAALFFGANASAQVHVPGDFATPQEAVDGSPDGSTIIIAGGTWGPLLIDKSLTLIGDPRATFEAAYAVPARYQSTADPAIFLDGPGSGTVKLVNLATSPSFDSFAAAGAHMVSNVSPGLVGGGFDAVRVLSCHFVGVEWVRSGLLSGVGAGEPGIQILPFTFTNSLPGLNLWVQDSYIQGSRMTNGWDDNSYSPFGATGISNSGKVVIINSTVIGGTHDNGVVTLTLPAGCLYAPGGLAVHAGTLYHSGSVLLPGAPASFMTSTGIILCTSSQGPTLQVFKNLVTSNASLFSVDDIHLGQPYTLVWALAAPADSGLIVVSTAVTRAKGTRGGLRFFDPTQIFMLESTGFGRTGTRTYSVPGDPSLLGIETVFQTWGFKGGGFSAPLIAIVRP